MVDMISNTHLTTDESTAADNLRHAVSAAKMVPAIAATSGKAVGPPVSLQSITQRTVIEPVRGWQWINVRELWKFRELLAFLVWRDVKVRYKQTLLGAAWAVLQPALMMVVFTLFFGRLARLPAGELPYPIFVYAGLLPWTFFATSIAHSSSSVIGSERLITKVYFPRLAIPLASVGAAIIDFLIAGSLLLGLMLWYGITPNMSLWLVPLLCVLLTMLAAGVGALLAALNVAYRDFRYVIPFMIQLWMFATPTIYMDISADRSQQLAYILALNPLEPVISSFRSAVLGGPIAMLPLVISATMCLATFVLGCLYFRRVEASFSDII